MKKILFVLLFMFMISGVSQAKDYAKLQVKEMQHAQKYGTTNKYFSSIPASSETKLNTYSSKDALKDPHLMHIGVYEKIDQDAYDKKIRQDYIEYKKIAKTFGIRNLDNYDAQAKGEDYYRIYRIAEKIIRANNLSYLNWRIGIYRDSTSPNAFNANVNYIAISTSLYDTFANNEDALAMIIGHEMGHALLGHQERSMQLLEKMEKVARIAKGGGLASNATYAAMRRKYIIDSKNMEFAADVEGAKLAAKAGYNIDNGTAVLSYFNTISTKADLNKDHPNAEKRLENLRQNRKYFVEEEWKNAGEYNIYNSNVIPVSLSSDRASIIINSTSEENSNKYYRPESMPELYARLAYKSYLNREFDKSIDYFEKLFEIEQSNAPAYLYASYASEMLYNQTGKSKYLDDSKEYAKKARSIEPNNKYIKEQIEQL